MKKIYYTNHKILEWMHLISDKVDVRTRTGRRTRDKKTLKKASIHEEGIKLYIYLSTNKLRSTGGNNLQN
jgi:hypothetical protein